MPLGVFGLLLAATGTFLVVAEDDWTGLILVVGGVLVAAMVGLVLALSVRTRVPTTKPPPGVAIRFRARRTFFTTATPLLVILVMAAVVGAWVLWGPPLGVGRAVLAVVAAVTWVFFVPPEGGRRTYAVTADELVIESADSRRSVRWDDVESVWHRPFVVVAGDGLQHRYDDRLELTTTGGTRPLVVVGAHRQARLSLMIVDLSREHVRRRLLATFAREGRVQLGELSVDHDGVQGPDGRRLPWEADWRVRSQVDEQGVSLVVRAPQGQTVAGRVPEEGVARELLTTLRDQFTSG
ncbi:hypothetical protein D7223_05485 [Micromonospora endolithica]|uniref:Uncharacterized protein n=1 Tax=Micromonospora endolithica TaxID=230091 RepID=A0A3A9ZSB0_9ACTN|nr:hypothetical protein D7223_05485 [Micromonospora endolithica]TWJ22363.1 hypothetical protein JD76_02478 [Micromonospora endolithica]